MPFDYLRSEAKTGRMGSRLMAIVAEGTQGRVYLTPTPEHEAVAEEAEPKWTPDTNLPERALGFRVQEYGMTKWRDLFTPRQLVALTTFSDLVAEAMERVKDDMLGSRAGRPRRGQDALDPKAANTTGVAPSSPYHYSSFGQARRKAARPGPKSSSSSSTATLRAAISSNNTATGNPARSAAPRSSTSASW